MEKITTEKAAVISKGSIVISAAQESSVANVIKEVVLNKGATLKWIKPIPKTWKLGIPGEIQRKNASIAKVVIEELATLGWKIEENHIKQGLEKASWPGRLQKTTWGGKPILLDGAHNPNAAKELAKERLLWDKNEYGVKWICGIQSSKNAPEMLKLLLHKNDEAWLVPIKNYNSWTKNELLEICPHLSNQLNEASNIEEVLESFLTDKWPEPCPIITGSLFLFENFLFNASESVSALSLI